MGKRECGDCKVCCTLMGVTEISKPRNVKCDMLCDTGCGSYESRPPSCKDFKCMWLREDDLVQLTTKKEYVFRNMERPDRVGIMFDVGLPDSKFEKETGQRPLAAWETRPGAFKEPAAKELIERLSKKVLLLMKPFGDGNKTVFAGPAALEKVVKKFVVKMEHG